MDATVHAMMELMTQTYSNVDFALAFYPPLSLLHLARQLLMPSLVGSGWVSILESLHSSKLSPPPFVDVPCGGCGCPFLLLANSSLVGCYDSQESTDAFAFPSKNGKHCSASLDPYYLTQPNGKLRADFEHSAPVQEDQSSAKNPSIIAYY